MPLGGVSRLQLEGALICPPYPSVSCRLNQAMTRRRVEELGGELRTHLSAQLQSALKAIRWPLSKQRGGGLDLGEVRLSLPHCCGYLWPLLQLLFVPCGSLIRR